MTHWALPNLLILSSKSVQKETTAMLVFFYKPFGCLPLVCFVSQHTISIDLKLKDAIWSHLLSNYWNRDSFRDGFDHIAVDWMLRPLFFLPLQGRVKEMRK